ncbi:MAG: oligosaccharide flippase family protein [Acidobacteriota bacterium]|nr:oligosaccharide flippase family protein [Acidobacteriota bacterium]
MNRTKRFVGGVGFGYANQLIITLGGLWVTPFLLHRIGQRDYGLWLAGTQILTYLTLMDFGVITLLPRETAYATGRAGGWNRAIDLPEILGRTAKLVLWQLPVIGIGAMALWFSVPPDWEALRQPAGIILIAFTLTFPFRILPAVLQGLQDLIFLGQIQVFSSLANLAVVVALVFLGWGLYALAAGWIAAQVTLAAISFLRIRARFPGVLPSRLPRLPRAIAREQLQRGVWVTVSQIAQVLLNGTDVVIIGRMFGPSAIVPYVFTGKLITVLSNQPQMLIQAAGPALSEMKTGETSERQLQACHALSQATLLVSGAVAAVVLLVNRGFITWWVGANQYSGFTLSALLLLAMLLRHWNNPLVYAIFCFGGERRIALTGLCDGIVTLGTSILFVWLFGAIGAPLGSILGVLLVSLPANLLGLARGSGHRVAELMRAPGPWFWRFAMLAPGIALITRYWVPSTFISLAAAVMLIGSVYAAVMIPAALKNPLGIYTLLRLLALRAKLFGAPVLSGADA